MTTTTNRILLTLATVTATLTAQTQVTSAWQPIANAEAPYLTTWDSTRQTTVLLCRDGLNLRMGEWNGTAVLERKVGYQFVSPFWIGDDPLRGRLVTLGLAGPGVTLIGEWDGARWTAQTPASSPNLDEATVCTFDQRRGRLVALHWDTTGLLVHEWDGSQWWTTSSALAPTARTAAAFAFDPLGNRCVLYGGTANGVAVADCWTWNGSSWTLLAASAAPGARTGAAMTFDPAVGGLLLYGGGASTTTWRLTGASWTQLPTTNDPGPRTHALLARDVVGTLLIGGATPDEPAWRFVAGDWQPVAATFVRPAQPWSGGAAFDNARGQAVLLAGILGDNRTYLYDTRWHAPRPTQTPSPRNFPHMCWSPGDQMVLLFGGGDANNAALGDTWSWTGTDWVQRQSAQSPSPRTGAAIGEDATGGVMLFGGATSTGPTNEHWRWDGTSWQQLTPPLLPPAMNGIRCAFDPVRGRTVLPTNRLTPPADTWEWDGTTWAIAGAWPTNAPNFPGRRLAFDPRRGAVVSSSYENYEWNGATWSLISYGPRTIGDEVVTDRSRSRMLALGETASTFTPTPAGIAEYGTGCAFGPSPLLAAIGDPSPGNGTFAIDVAALTAGAPTILALGLTQQSLALGAGCTALVGTQLGTRFALAGAAAQARHGLPLPGGTALLGVQFTAQAAVVDPARSLFGSVTLTPGMLVTIGD